MDFESGPSGGQKMAMTLTPKQEKFCQRFIETGNASEAYRSAYSAGSMSDKSVNEEAAKLLRHPKVAPRVQELKGHHAKRHDMTVDDIAAMLVEDRNFARQCETPGAAVSASMGLAKLYGHLTDKVDHTTAGQSLQREHSREEIFVRLTSVWNQLQKSEGDEE